MSTRERRTRDKNTKDKSYEIDVITDVPAFDVDNFVWVKVKEGEDKRFVFKKAKILEKKEEKGALKFTVETEDDNHKMEDLSAGDVFPVNPPSCDKVRDMTRLQFYDAPSVYHNLAQRYGEDTIYTYSGLFLVVINPYKQLPIYTPEVIESYKGKSRDEMAPHVYSIAEAAYRNMLNTKVNQSMLVTGESGAGKTENTKKIIQYLTAIARKGEGELEKQIVQTNPLLESFGNAKTVKNNNSSRFGKFIEICFNSSGFIVGAKIVNYLLETIRVLDSSTEERNFHIFYQIFTETSICDKYALTRVEDYEILKNRLTKVSNIDDAKEWKQTLETMKTVDINESEQHMIFSIIAACLHLGNIKYEKDENEYAALKDTAPCKKAASLLGVNPNILFKALAKPVLKVKDQVIETNETPDRALFNTQALIKSLYRRLFNWLIMKVNATLASKETVKNTIGILDIAGFEIFKLNSYEQLCINYTNEKLQQFFNTHMFKKEQEEYARENIEWKYIDFGMDLQPTIDVIEKQGGIFALCDEQTTLGQNNDKVLMTNLKKNWKDSPIFKPDVMNPMKFDLKHYAAYVTYDVDQWLNKNTDPLTADSENCISGSRNPLIKTMFELSSAKKKGAKFMSIAREYKEQLETLMTVLRSTEPHFIRCIIPNHKMKAGFLEPDIVIGQLACNGVIEGIRISRKGYPNRIIFNEFIQRYKVIAKSDELDAQQRLADKVAVIVKNAPKLKLKEHYMIGQTKIFFKAGAESFIEKVRDERVSEIILCAQSAIRGYLARKKTRNMREQINSAKVIRQNWSEYYRLKEWLWWKALMAARALATTSNVQQENVNHKKNVEKVKNELDEETRDKKRAQKEKGEILVNIEKLKGEILANEQRIESNKGDIQRLTERESELKNQIDGLTREKKLVDDEIKNSQSKVNDADNVIAEKDKQRDDLNSSLGSGSEEAKKLKQLLEDLQKERLKLEQGCKTLDDDIRESRNKLDNEILKQQDLERQKAQLEDKVKESNYKLTNSAKDRQNTESRLDGAIKALKETDTSLKQALEDIQKLMGEDAKKTSDISIVQAESDDFRRKGETVERDRRNLENTIKELQEKITDTESKKSLAERQLRNAKEDFEDHKKQLEKLAEEFHHLDDTGNLTRDEIGQTRLKVGVLDDETQILLKKKTDLEKDINSYKFETDEARARYERAQEVATKKLQETEKGLTEQINSQNQQKNALEVKSKQLRDQYNELKKTTENLSSEKETLDAKYKRLEQSLTGEQQELLSVKKQTGDLETQSRSLLNKQKELDTKLRNESEDNQRLEQKRIQLQSMVNDQKDHFDHLVKEKEDLDRERNSLKSQLNSGKNEQEGKRDTLNQLKVKTGNQDAEIKGLKDKIDTTAKGTEQQKQKNKDSELKLQTANVALETEKTEKKNIEVKIQRAEQTIQRLKEKLEEEKTKTKNEQEARAKSDSELKDKRQALEAEQKQISDLNRKAQNISSKTSEIEQLNSENGSKISKLRSAISQLESKKASLEEKLEELHKKNKEGESGKSQYKQKLDEAEKLRVAEQQMSQKLTIDNQKLKTELEKLRISGDENDRKAIHTLESLKIKSDGLEQDHEQVLKRLNEEKADLKKQIKNAAKYASKDKPNEPVVEGGVTQEAIDKTTKEFNEDLEKLRAELESQKKEKLAIEAQKRNLDMQLNTVREQLEQEERNRKKLEVQKKSLQMEYDEVRALADEAEDLKEEMDQVKLESETYAKELKEEKEREKKQRQQAEELTEKRKGEVEEIKKQLSESKQESATLLKSLRSKYEREVSEMEELVEKAKKEKLKESRGTKKTEQQARDVQRKLQNAETDLRVAEDKASNLEKELKRLQSETSSQSRKLATFEGNNKLLEKDQQELREKVKQFEEQLQKLKNAPKKSLEDDE